MNRQEVVNPFARARLFFVPATLFGAWTTHHAWQNGGEILVFLGVTLVFGGAATAGFSRSPQSHVNGAAGLLLVIGLILFLVGAIWTPTQR